MKCRNDVASVTYHIAMSSAGLYYYRIFDEIFLRYDLLPRRYGTRHAVMKSP